MIKQLIFRSIELDFELIQLPFSIPAKLDFIFQKYISLIKEISPFINKKRMARVFGRDFFYDDKYALGILQSTFTDNAFLKYFIKKNSIIIDIGANIGQFRLFSEQFLKAKHVYSFEPIPQTFEILQKNFPTNNFPYAISTKKELKFFLPSLSVWASSVPHKGSGPEQIVRGMQLDHVKELLEEKSIDLLKIDVEGAERDVIEASKKIIEKSKYVLIELSLERESLTDPFILLARLKEIIPKVRLIHVGRSYNDPITDITGAVDILFFNPTA